MDKEDILLAILGFARDDAQQSGDLGNTDYVLDLARRYKKFMFEEKEDE